MYIKQFIERKDLQVVEDVECTGVFGAATVERIREWLGAMKKT